MARVAARARRGGGEGLRSARPIIARHARLPQPAPSRPCRALGAHDRQLRRRAPRSPGDARAARLRGCASRPAGDGAHVRAEPARLLRAPRRDAGRQRRRASRRCATRWASSSAAASRKRSWCASTPPSRRSLPRRSSRTCSSPASARATSSSATTSATARAAPATTRRSMPPAPGTASTSRG